MISADAFLGPARVRGFDFYTGVPCSFLTPMINRVISDRALDYVGAASEGEAVAIASGAWLAGRKTVVMCQNSGLGNAVNPLTSLNEPFQIPTMMIVTWRGQPGLKDEPQHALMGEITGGLLDVMRIPHRPFPNVAENVGPALDDAEASMAKRSLPFAFIMEKSSLVDEVLDEAVLKPLPLGRVEDLLTPGPAQAMRHTLLERLLSVVGEDTAIIASTGFCGRELFTIADRPQHLYQVGSMGCAAGMGLGVALNSKCPVVVLDGDGAALMKMGTFATVGARGSENLIHIVLDNGVHESTGGQATVSSVINFAKVAIACNYRHAWSCDNESGFADAMVAAMKVSGPSLIHVRTKPGKMDNLGRPTIGPVEVAQRFKAFLAG